ncbi:L,D-transpeptidase [Polymorphobacter sp.]|uniref:L,D-transpeptidase n=1 Tax=Polymorphobacter sp. TaxID=1909290 RepID=UPI003F6F699E
MTVSRRSALMLLPALIASRALAQGAATPSSYETRVLALKPGEFIWDGEIAPSGPMMVVVNLSTQRAWVYRNGVRIGASTISSGKAGKRTPTGVFQILQKNKDHRSNLYNSAPMPYMQRLTWDGIALHAGNLPGYPASHGCIRLPMAFARALFEASPMGMTVVVVDEKVVPESVDEAAILAPLGPKGQALVDEADPEDEGGVSRWTPERAPTGPVTVVLTTANKRIIVYRNGVEIGRSRVGVPDGFQIGTRAAQFAGRDASGRAQWIYLGLSSYQERAGQAVEKDAIDQIAIPPVFFAHLREIIGEGTTLLATDGGILGGSTGKQLTVMAND